MARALTKPVITDWETNRISRPSFRKPARIWKTPIRMVAANRYWTPWSRTRSVITTAVAAVAAEIMAGRPPVKAITMAMTTEANRPTFGSTPAITEKPIASGISARATTMPDRTSPRMLENQSRRKVECMFMEMDIRNRRSLPPAHRRDGRSGHLRCPADRRPEEPPGVSPGPVEWLYIARVHVALQHELGRARSCCRARTEKSPATGKPGAGLPTASFASVPGRRPYGYFRLIRRRADSRRQTCRSCGPRRSRTRPSAPR